MAGPKRHHHQLITILLSFIFTVCLIEAQQADENTNCPAKCLCFGTTTRCMFLNLHGIPSTIPPDTTILDLRFNKIREVQHGALKNLTRLTTLLLNNNHLRKIGNDAFEGLVELRNLYLYKNHIRDIDQHAFRGLPKVEQIYLHFNQLHDLPSELFSNLPSLERLFLHNNLLEHLPSGIFSSLSSLRRLRLDSNALVCDCRMMWLSEMLKTSVDFSQATVTCEGPDPLKGKPIIGMTMEDFHCKKPEFTVEPTDLDVVFGGTAYFTCKAEGDPAPEIIWLRNDEEILTNSVDHSRYTILDDGTLMIEDAQMTDKGVYECMARNAAGESKAKAAQLNMEQGDQPAQIEDISNTYASRPRIVRAPQNYAVVQGESIALECRAVGIPTPTVTWTLNDLPLPQDPRYRLVDSSTLIVDGVGGSDRGLFRCTASNIAGATSVNSRVEILVPPSISERPSDQTITEGQPAYFTCRVIGQPTPEIQWFKDGREMSVYGGRYTVSDAGTTLWIDHVALRDSGNFECRAENDAGRTDATAVLVINPRVSPVLLRGPVDAIVPEGATAQFTCLIQAEPPASIRWLKNSRSLFTSNKYEMTRNEQSLIVRSANVGDEGLYECVAENTAGSVNAVARLSILGSTSDNQINRIDNSVVRGTVLESLLQVGRAFNSTLAELQDPSRPRTPSDLFTLLRLPSSGQALQLTRSAEVFERTISLLHEHVHAGAMFNISHDESTSYQELLTPFQLDIVADLSGCATHRRVIDCEDMCYHNRYRTFDGTCNNLKHPMRGASLTPMNRILPPRYENGFNTPPGWNDGFLYKGYRLPSARRVSTHLIAAQRVTDDEDFTHMLMQWGQFHDHDITFVPQAVSNARFSDGRHCNETCENQSPCFPIPIPAGDHRIHRYRCMGVTRSSAMCGSGMTSVFFKKVLQREQMNQITAFIDASSVYGSSEDEARNLRDFTTNNGLLRTGRIMPSGKPLLPPNVGEPVDCQMDPNTRHIPCFQAGDHRNNEQLGLLSMHTLWMREHNRLAQDLRRYNQHWDGDTLYHETRKIVGAMFQHITFKHWLPKILGPIGMDQLGEYKGYKPDVDSSIFNSFATAAFRFGHGLIHPLIYRLNETMQPTRFGNLHLHKAFFAPFRLVEEGGIDPILRGMYGVAAKQIRPGELLNTELTERLFMLAHDLALDLAALNIQRGRDHGLPSYNAMRKECGLPGAERFDDLAGEISDWDARNKLRELYGHPDNIDMWVGGMSEDKVRGARIGPTFMCILVRQFQALRDGDRFWYENPGMFTPSQLLEIQSVTLSRVICDNGDNIGEVPPDVFARSSYPADYKQCDTDDIPKLDIKVWAGCCYDCSRSGNFRSITGHFSRRRRSTDDGDSFSYADDRPQGDEPEPAGGEESEVKGGEKEKEEEDHHHEHHEAHTMSEHTMIDIVDSRIEGMEEMMGKVMKSVHKLSRKMRRMEKHMKGRRGHHKDTCEDTNGAIRKHNEKWREHDCRVCECKNGVLECTTETCQLPSCVSPVKVPGQCCPVCV